MAKKWIQKALPESHRGNLHRALHVPLDEKIPASKLAKGAKEGGKLAKMVSLARTLKKMH